MAIAIQLVPYGRDHTNPAVVSEPPWDSVATRTLAAGACFDCHSNETEWPWYSHVAPMSWLVTRDVLAGRDELNLSEWDGDDGEDAAETIVDGSMPPFEYRLLHADARLSDSEMQALADGLLASLGGDADDDDDRDDDEDDRDDEPDDEDRDDD